MDVCEW